MPWRLCWGVSGWSEIVSTLIYLIVGLHDYEAGRFDKANNWLCHEGTFHFRKWLSGVIYQLALAIEFNHAGLSISGRCY
jgi:hypothetical protein